jgi:5-methyltetrahydropteroyltriglutamate--homocysteine methyltransferase
MNLMTTLSGSYPKLPTEPGDANVRVVRNRMDQGKATAEDLERAVEATTRRVVALQDAAGIDIPVDGQIAWDDEQTPVARGLQGFGIAGLIRYLDTNTYYREPEITGPVRWTAPITVEAFRFAQGLTSRPLKAVLPGPYSLYRFSKDLHYRDPLAALRALGEALAAESAALEAAGARWIHYEEPWLGRTKAEDAPRVRAALEPLLSDRRAATVIHVPFRSPRAVFPALRDLPWSAIGLDLVESPDAWGLLADVPAGRTVALGLVNARNTYLEEPGTVADAVGRARAERPDLDYHLCPTASLEYLPADRAAEKVRRLAEAARLAAGNGGRP